MNTVKKFASIIVFPALTLAAHLVASRVLGLYAVLPQLDIPFHFIGGASIAYAAVKALGFLQSGKRILQIDRFILPVLILAITSAAAVGWELMEFGLDQLLGTNIQVSLANTMQDQFIGLLGGSLVAGRVAGYVD